MALNRSPEFKSSDPKSSAASSWDPEATKLANLEKLYYAILNIKFIFELSSIPPFLWSSGTAFLSETVPF